MQKYAFYFGEKIEVHSAPWLECLPLLLVPLPSKFPAPTVQIKLKNSFLIPSHFFTIQIRHGNCINE